MIPEQIGLADWWRANGAAAQVVIVEDQPESRRSARQAFCRALRWPDETSRVVAPGSVSGFLDVMALQRQNETPTLALMDEELADMKWRAQPVRQLARQFSVPGGFNAPDYQKLSSGSEWMALWRGLGTLDGNGSLIRGVSITRARNEPEELRGTARKIRGWFGESWPAGIPVFDGFVHKPSHFSGYWSNQLRDDGRWRIREANTPSAAFRKALGLGGK